MSPWYRWHGAVPARKCHVSHNSISGTYISAQKVVPDEGVGRGLPEPLSDNTTGIATGLYAREPAH